ncbi:pleckstrin homology domain-containing family J member 1 isoform X2 [Nasonia vitripennis]|uniref:Pleckstrin homology domain-containing family J member 1 n=1 Tax=Nasonia vitripennis TaxID=7425 RepID=A0A7M7GN28_NASVI|nr:pleckstrin homology domain-containing family J member 1 isoform X2 [Nasonia vitripennis]
MKFNCKELAEIYFGPAELEGRLHHKRSHKSGFKERWFKLRYNFLFYHNTNEFGQADGIQPSGVIILENCNIKPDVVRESCFAFSIVFNDEPQKCHILSGRSESQIEQWMNAIKQASYGYWRSQLIVLQQILCNKTGKDPLLMYPRNKDLLRVGTEVICSGDVWQQ